ncbi:MAG TPA: phosphoglucomutase/phosphomannomutase family protein [Terriglobales bacterium]|nr:phosphoglucomutase/phosphomannomutase family protein [Terriglobales bacterium]
MAAEIKFGTDGWRGIIADDFTFDNVRRVAAAVAAYVHKHEDAKQGLVVGYDTRFASLQAARIAAEVIAATGIPVRLSNDHLPTPAVSYAVKKFNAAGGLVVTSSHNPWQWNGVKYKAGYGGSATATIMKKIEAELQPEPLARQSGGQVTETDFKAPYIDAITRFADLDRIARAGFNIAVDSMYGSGRGVLTGIFGARGIRHVGIRQELDPLFGGVNPEPIEPHIQALREAVEREHCHAGFATDGDADRIGAIAEDGSFVDAHKCFAVILQWLLERRPDWTGAVVRAFNTTGMLDRIATRYGRKLHECGIGFKHICDLMLNDQVLVGGEESGGIGITRHLPERDGILNSLLLANIMAEEGKTLAQLVDRLQKEYGPHYFGRRDLHIPDDLKQSAIRRASSAATLSSLGPHRVVRRSDLDGIKLFLDAPRNGNGAEAWVLLRASGTEPLLRVYSEASSPQLVAEILSAAEDFVLEKATAG